MATSVDTNVISFLLLDAEQGKADAAQAALETPMQAGNIVVCGPVFAELLATEVWDAATLLAALAEMRFDLDLSMDTETWAGAVYAYAGYLRTRRPTEYMCPKCQAQQRFRCRACRQELSWPKHILSDFLIGAHAARRGHALLTDDTGLYASFFPHLPLRRL